jgi:hypothetical protein
VCISWRYSARIRVSTNPTMTELPPHIKEQLAALQQPQIPDHIRKHVDSKKTSGVLPLDRQALLLAMIAKNLTTQLNRKGFAATVETRPSGFTLHVDIPNHPTLKPPPDLDDFTVGQ